MTEENTQNQAVPAVNPAPAAAPTAPVAESAPTEKVAETQTPGEKAQILPELRSGMTVRVHQKIKETNTKGEEKERIQIYEGMIIAMKHGKEPGGTITVRKISDSVGVEKIFPIYSPNVAKIEPVKQAKVRQSKLHFLRDWKKKLKEKII